MKKIKKILIASILIIGIVIGVTYANLQKGANSTETENKLFINSNPDNIGIILGDGSFKNWSLSMPNSSIDQEDIMTHMIVFLWCMITLNCFHLLLIEILPKIS